MVAVLEVFEENQLSNVPLVIKNSHYMTGYIWDLWPCCQFYYTFRPSTQSY